MDPKTILNNLFLKAKSKDEFEYICALLRIRGMESAGWDPFEEISSPKIARGFQGEGALSGAQSAFVHMYIVNNFKGESVMNLFSTHPPVKERVKRPRSITKI